MPQKLVITYLIDGARPDVMRELLDAGELPNIARHVVEPGTFRTATTVMPSTTGPAYLPFLTGCYPGTLNIPGIRWLDRREFFGKLLGKYRFRSYNGIEAPWFDDDMPVERPTLYEIFDRPLNILSLITRGLPRGNNLTKWSKPFYYLRAHLTDEWHKVDALSHRRLLRCLDRDPDYVFAVFPAVDSFSHLHHPRHEDTLLAYRNVDRSVAEVAARLQQLGRYDDTLLLLTADHGLTATHTHLDLGQYFQKRGVDTLTYPGIWKLRPQASVMISGNSLGLVYLLHGMNGTGAGRDRPRDLPPYDDEIKTELGPVWDELISRDEIDLLIARRNDRAYAVMAQRGTAVIERHADGLTYRPESGDPLGLGAIATPLASREALVATFDSDYPDVLVQIDQLFSCSRCGDLVVIARNGYDLRTSFEWPEHHGSHGSLRREHMHVPVIYNRQGWTDGPMRTTDLFNTVLKWSGRQPVENTDGEILC